jgi:hypothetical protein
MSEKKRNDRTWKMGDVAALDRYTPQPPSLYGYQFPLPENARDSMEFLPPKIQDPIVMPPGELRGLYGKYIDPTEDL